MKKAQAIHALHEGKKLTHMYFTEDEWVTDSGGGYEFEDGCKCTFNEFWQDRSDSGWDNDWSIWDE